MTAVLDVSGPSPCNSESVTFPNIALGAWKVLGFSGSWFVMGLSH